MTEQLLESVYDTLTGRVSGAHALPGVENAFAEGTECMELYGQMLSAYERLCERLGVQDEDADVEIIIQKLMRIEGVLCRAMYRYGAKLALEYDR